METVRKVARIFKGYLKVEGCMLYVVARVILGEPASAIQIYEAQWEGLNHDNHDITDRLREDTANSIKAAVLGACSERSDAELAIPFQPDRLGWLATAQDGLD